MRMLVYVHVCTMFVGCMFAINSRISLFLSLSLTHTHIMLSPLSPQGEKYLYLRPEYQTAARPPSGRTSAIGSERASVSSIEADPRNSLQNRDSLSQLISDLLSPTPTTSDSHFTDFGSVPSAQNYSPYSSTGRGGASDSTSMFSSTSRSKNDVVLQSYKPISTSTTSATPSYQTGSSGPTSSTVSPSPYSSSSMTNATSTAAAAPTNSSLFSSTSSSGLGDMGLGSLGGDLMSSFGDLFSSFGTSSSTTANGSGLGGLTSTPESGSSKLFDSPTTKSTTSYSSTTTSSTAAPQGGEYTLFSLSSLKLSLPPPPKKKTNLLSLYIGGVTLCRMFVLM